MTEIVVWGACPVGIHVETETGEVTRVVIIDEGLIYPKNIDTPVLPGDLAVTTPGYGVPWLDLRSTSKEITAARREATKALEIARGDSGVWPAWEFGY